MPSALTVASQKVPLRGLSLFSGGGGMDIGAVDAGIEILGCIELDRNACETLRINHTRQNVSTQVIEGSVLDYPPDRVGDLLGVAPGELDILFGGPPCQSFSQIGKRGSVSDERGMLLYQMVEFARFFQPRFVVIENVSGLLKAPDLSGRRGGVLDRLSTEMQSLGYQVDWAVLNSAEFGVAQKRIRLFFVADLRGHPSLPLPTHVLNADQSLFGEKPLVTVGSVIAGLGRPAKKGESRLDSHVDVTPTGDRRRIAGVPEGGHLAGCRDLPPEQRGRLTAKDTTKFLRLNRDKQSNTLRCGEIFFHPTEDRYLTPREYMRIHGYPDSYELHGPIRGRSGSVRELDQHRLIANSVPPPLAHAVFAALLEARVLRAVSPLIKTN